MGCGESDERGSTGVLAGWRSFAVDLSFLLLVFLVFYGRYIFGGDALPCIGETRDEFYPLVRYSAESICRGVIPLWDPYSACGTPHASLGYASAFYPATFVYGLGNYAVWVKVGLLGHLLMGVFWSYVLGRSLFRHRAAAVALGMLFLSSGTVSLATASSNPGLAHFLAWFPFCLFCLLRLLHSGRWFWGAGFSLGLTLLLLGGSPLSLLFALSVFGLLTGLDLVRRLVCAREAPGMVVRKGMLALGAVFVALLIGACQMAPFFELVYGESIRTLSGDERYYAQWRPALTMQTLLGWNPHFHWPFRVYILPPAALGLAAFGLTGRGVRKLWPLYVTVVISAFVGFGGSAFLADAVSFLSFLARVRGVSRVTLVSNLLLTVLAAYGIDHAIGLAREGRFRLAHAGLASVACAFFCFAPLSDPCPEVWASLAAIAVLVVGIFWSCARPAKGRILGLTLMAAVVIDLCGVPYHNLGDGKPSDHELGPDDRALFALMDDHDRAHILSNPGAVTRYPRSRCSGLLGRSRELAGYNALSLARYASLLNQAESGGAPKATFDLQEMCRVYVRTAAWLTERTAPALNLLNVRRVASYDGAIPWIEESIERGEGRYSRQHVGELTVYENHGAFPVAFTVHEARLMESPSELLKTLVAPEFDARRIALVESPLDEGQLAPASGEEPVQVTAYAENAVTVEVEMTAPGLLVLTDMYYPGWRARIDDGEPESVLCVDHALRGVLVPEGRHEVRFEYRPASVRYGLLVSIATVLTLTVALVAALARTGRRRAASA